jgi:hypothetical protein
MRHRHGFVRQNCTATQKMMPSKLQTYFIFHFAK